MVTQSRMDEVLRTISISPRSFQIVRNRLMQERDLTHFLRFPEWQTAVRGYWSRLTFRTIPIVAGINEIVRILVTLIGAPTIQTAMTGQSRPAICAAHVPSALPFVLFAPILEDESGSAHVALSCRAV